MSRPDTLCRTLLLRARSLASFANSVCSKQQLQQQLHHAAGLACDDSREDKSIDEGKTRGTWFTLPPFTPSVDSASLGRRLAGSSDSASGDRTALKWVLRCCPELPRSRIQKLFRLKQVRVECMSGEENDPRAQAQSYKLKRVTAKDVMGEGDVIVLPQSVGDHTPAKKAEYKCSEKEQSFVQDLVLYKDESIIAINKPPGLPVQGGVGINKSVDQLAASYCRYDYEEFPRLVHRLDRDSSGILIMGRTQTSAAVLHSIFHEKTICASDHDIDSRKKFLQKRYLALVIGSPGRSKGVISAPLAKVIVDDGKSERITISKSAKSSQHAVTEYRVIETTPYGYTWLELSPHTGRKHQLRVHCAEGLGTPIVGDYKYGWQAHRRWSPLLDTDPGTNSSAAERRSSDLGSIVEKQPHLHLHCKQVVLPNISLALRQASSSLLKNNHNNNNNTDKSNSNNDNGNDNENVDCDFSKVESINLVAPLPSHMQRSWDALNSLAERESGKESFTVI